MSLIPEERFRGVVATLLAALVLCIGVRPALAAPGHRHKRPQPSVTDDNETKAPPTDAEKPTPDKSDESPKPPNPPTEATPAPRLQLQDEGPPTGTRDTVDLSSRARAPVVEDTDERPFWKSWIFWTVTGALVVGAVGLAVYSSSRTTSSSLAPCPVDVAVSLGCFGAGRGQ